MKTLRVRASDGVHLHVEVHGQAGGAPLVFAHEFAATCRGFDAQVAAFAATHRCVLFNARGYPPSDVPTHPDDYSEQRAADDLLAVLAALGDPPAHVVGVSMGAAAALQAALKEPGRIASLALASIGSGSEKSAEEVRTGTEANAALAQLHGTQALALKMADSPTRLRLREKQPQAWQHWLADFGGVPPEAAALTMRGVQQRRPSLYTHADRVRTLAVPMLVLAGAEDVSCVRAGEWLRDTAPNARLRVFERTGHAIQLEEPDRFDAVLGEFLAGLHPNR